MGEGLEPCFASIEPHALVFWDKVPELSSKTRFQIDEEGRYAFSVGRGRYIEWQTESKKFSVKIQPTYDGQEHLDKPPEWPHP